MVMQSEGDVKAAIFSGVDATMRQSNDGANADPHLELRLTQLNEMNAVLWRLNGGGFRLRVMEEVSLPRRMRGLNSQLWKEMGSKNLLARRREMTQNTVCAKKPTTSTTTTTTKQSRTSRCASRGKDSSASEWTKQEQTSLWTAFFVSAFVFASLATGYAQFTGQIQRKSRHHPFTT